MVAVDENTVRGSGVMDALEGNEGHFETVAKRVEDLELAELNMEQLREQAELRGVKLKSTDKAGMIDELISASVESPTEAQPGVLVSLHSRTDEAKALIKKVRNIMVKNEEGGKTFTLFLKNREGTFYNQKGMPGCRVSEENIDKIWAILSPLPDGSQDALLKDFRANPSKYEQPLLVRVVRKQSEGPRDTTSYVMLYLKLKQKLVEETF